MRYYGLRSEGLQHSKEGDSSISGMSRLCILLMSHAKYLKCLENIKCMDFLIALI